MNIKALNVFEQDFIFGKMMAHQFVAKVYEATDNRPFLDPCFAVGAQKFVLQPECRLPEDVLGYIQLSFVKVLTPAKFADALTALAPAMFDIMAGAFANARAIERDGVNPVTESRFNSCLMAINDMLKSHFGSKH